MNDRFKFRTYIPDLKFFKYWGWVEDWHYVNMCACGDYSMSELLKNYTDQCTGLKDKNGKLIYEGDIVKHSKSNQQYKVQWNDKGFWQLDDYAMARSSKFLEENYEVIGNIYENKELLESEG